MIFRQKGREGEREWEKQQDTSICCFSQAPHWGLGPQPRHVPWLGIELATLWFTACIQSTELHQPGRLNCFKQSTLMFNIKFLEEVGFIFHSCNENSQHCPSIKIHCFFKTMTQLLSVYSLRSTDLDALQNLFFLIPSQTFQCLCLSVYHASVFGLRNSCSFTE